MTKEPMDLETYNQLSNLKFELEKVLFENETVFVDAARDFWEVEDWHALFHWRLEDAKGKIAFSLRPKNPLLFQRWHNVFGRPSFVKTRQKLNSVGLDWTSIDPTKLFIYWIPTSDKAHKFIDLVIDGKVDIDGIEKVFSELDRQEEDLTRQLENIRAFREALVSD